MKTKHTVACFLLFFFSISFFQVTAQAETGFTGRVVEAANPNTGIANLWVDVFDCTTPNPSYTNGWIAGDSTDSNGNYKINVPTPGSYKIASLHLANTGYLDNWYNNHATPGTADCESVSNGQIAQLQDIALTQAVNGSISGVVTNDVGNINIANVYVYVYDSTGGATGAITDSNGAYTISNLLTGDYTVYFGAFYTPYTSEWYDNQLVQNQAAPVHVAAPADTPNINAQLASGGTISGKVTYKETGATIAGAWVDVCDSTSTVCNSSSPTWRGFAITDANGVYTVQGLPSPGTYKVQFYEKTVGNAGAGLSEFYNDKQNISSADSVTVSLPVGIINIDAALENLSGTISGKVTYKETGAAIAGAWVDVCDSTSTVCNSSSPTWRGFAITDANGLYTVQGLPSPGTYKVQFYEKTADNAGAGLSEFYNDKKNIADADPVSVGSTNIDAALENNPNLTLNPNLIQVYEVLLRKKKTCRYVAINGKTALVCQ